MSRSALLPAAALAVLLSLLLAACADDIPVPRPEELEVQQIEYGALGIVEVSWRLVVRVDAYRLHYDDDEGAPYDGTGLELVAWPEACGDFDAGVRRPSAADAAVDAFAGAAADAADAADAAVDAAADAVADASGAASADAAADGPAGPDSAPPAADGVIPAPGDAAIPDVLRPGRAAPSPIELPASWCLDTENTFSDAGIVPVQTPAKRPRARVQGLAAGKTYHFAVQAVRRHSASELSAPVAITVARQRVRP